MKKALLAFLTVILILASVPFTEKVDVRAGQIEPLRGIDVSLYQGQIDWHAVWEDGIRFAFVRVGTSRTIDSWFDYNLKEAHAQGLRTGVYWYTYATTVEEARAEAATLVSLIDDYTVSYPVVVDIEAEEQMGLSREELAALAEAFCEVVNDAGYFPMVYASRNWFQRRIGDISLEKWVAQYADTNTYDGDYGIWQYTSNGSVKGISTRVDMNYIYKDYAREIIPDGFMVRDDKTYFFSGFRRQKGLVEYNGTKYFFGDDFAMATGWINVNGADCYFDPDTGALEIEQLSEPETIAPAPETPAPDSGSSDSGTTDSGSSDSGSLEGTLPAEAEGSEAPAP